MASFVSEFLKNNQTLLRVLNETYSRFLPFVLDFNQTAIAAENFEKVATEIFEFYFGNGGIVPDKINRLVQVKLNF